MARINSHFWDFIAKKYARDPVANQEAYQRKLELTRQHMNKDMEVAEIGCGTGTTAIAHAPFVKHIHASDFSANMLKIAKEKASASNIGNITFTRARAEDIEVAPGTYDMVMAHSLLHLLKDRDSVIASIKKMLKPGGTFVSSTACIANLWGPRIFLPIGNMLGLLPLVRLLSAEDVARSISGAGFEIVEQWQPNKDGALFVIAKKPV